MSRNNARKTDLDLHKRMIFIQKLSPDTTKQSLREYLSKYPIERCSVPVNEAGANRTHGIVTFRDEESVATVMSQRPHRIDDKVVFVHRSVPSGEGSLKDTYGSERLIVSGVRNQSLIESDIRDYFSPYGTIYKINKMNNGDTVWIIDFDDYDSVDKILLDGSHRVGQIYVNVKRGYRDVLRPRTPMRETISTTGQSSDLSLLPKKYRIHITNLLADIDAETLSDELNWNIYNIVMSPSMSECWLKNAKDEAEVDTFIEQSSIQCEKEEDQFEFCNKFQFGRCQKADEYCHWEHVPCTAHGNCAPNCPFGHKLGTKSERDSPLGPSATATHYRVKFSGFKTTVTPDDLAHLLHVDSHNCYVDHRNVRVGYVIKIKTMRYAQQLMAKWHNKDINGQKIKCQLELSLRYDRTRSPAASIDGKLRNGHLHSRALDARSPSSSQATSDFDDTDSVHSISFDNRRFSDKISNITAQTLPSDVLTDEWEETTKATNSDGKVRLIRDRVDRKRLAVIKIYPMQCSDDFNRELIAMEELRDVKGVSKLIEQRSNRDQLWTIMERAPGHSLKEFIERTCQGVLQIPTAVKLTLNLINIIQQMHSKGIFHQNLSPENIMIEWNMKSSIDRAQLTVLNFSQAVIVSTKANALTPSSKEKWYYASQIDDQGLRSTIDPSGICAILFWLLTQIEPRYDNGALLHQEDRDKLNDMIKSEDRKMLVEEQLRRYLIDTFDRAFGYPHYHPWTIHDLKCRLESILRLLMPSEPKLNSIDGIFQELVSISDSVPTPSIAVNSAQLDAFKKASQALYQAKQYFVENEKNQYEWLHGHCIWIHRPHSWINERHNDDVLTYNSLHGRARTSCSVIITCLARSSEEGRVMTLFISSNVNGKTIEMPIGQYSIAQDYAIIVQENFKIELINLLSAIYHEQKSIEH